MSLRTYLILMILATLLSWIAWGLVIYLIDPAEADFLGLLCFYSSLLLAFSGSLALLGFFLRAKFLKSLPLFKHVIKAFRQGFLLASLLVLAFFLQSKRFLTWWNIILLVSIFTVLEFFFISHRSKPKGEK